jgi:hypothetical protein
MLVFYKAVFPRLARNTASTRELREKFEAGLMDKDEFEIGESLEKNRISNISNVHGFHQPANQC